MFPQKTILVVEANPRNMAMLIDFLAKQGYECAPVYQLSEVDQQLNNGHDIGLALVDISGFDADIWMSCEKIRQKGISLLVISPRQNINVQRESIRHGASGVLVKPLVMSELVSLMQSLISE